MVILELLERQFILKKVNSERSPWLNKWKPRTKIRHGTQSSCPMEENLLVANGCTIKNSMQKVEWRSTRLAS
jgi:hypothetical protein